MDRVYTLVTAIYNDLYDYAAFFKKFAQSIHTCNLYLLLDPGVKPIIEKIPSIPSNVHIVYYPISAWKVYQFYPTMQCDLQEAYNYEIKYFLEKAIQDDPFQTSYFAWHNPDYLERNPPVQLLKHTTVLLLTTQEPQYEKCGTLQIIQPKDAFVNLHVIMTHKVFWKWFIQEYNMTTYQYVYNGVSGFINEESLYTSMVYLFPNMIDRCNVVQIS